MVKFAGESHSYVMGGLIKKIPSPAKTVCWRMWVEHKLIPPMFCSAAEFIGENQIKGVAASEKHTSISNGGYHRIFNPQPPRPKSVENFSIRFSTHPPSGARAAWGRNVMLVNYLTHPPSGARVAWGRNVFVVYYSTHPP